jgi:hypothetical protein
MLYLLQTSVTSTSELLSYYSLANKFSFAALLHAAYHFRI